MRLSSKPTHRIIAISKSDNLYAFGKQHLVKLMTECFNSGAKNLIIRKTTKIERNSYEFAR